MYITLQCKIHFEQYTTDGIGTGSLRVHCSPVTTTDDNTIYTRTYTGTYDDRINTYNNNDNNDKIL